MLKERKGIGYAHWASYLIYGDATGFSISDTPSDPNASDREIAQADAFAAWLGGHIVDCSSESFFASPDAGAKLPGDCIEYTALVEE